MRRRMCDRNGIHLLDVARRIARDRARGISINMFSHPRKLSINRDGRRGAAARAHRRGDAVKILRFLVICSLLATGVSCKNVSVKHKEFEGFSPRTVAVLPADGTLPERGRRVLRNLIGSFLQEKQYIKIDDAFVDMELAKAGFEPWREGWIPNDAAIYQFGRALGADAVLCLSGFEDQRFSAGVLYRRGLAGMLRWMDTKTEKIIFTSDLSASKTGGLALESGQVLKAISNTTENGGEEQFARLAASVAFDFINSIPDAKITSELAGRPVVQSLQLKGNDIIYAGQTWGVELRGTPRSRGMVMIEGCPGEYPLHEISPGLYTGEFRADAGLGEVNATISAVLFSLTGDPSEPKNGGTLRISAPRLDPPNSVNVSILDATKRETRVVWNSVPGAKGYDVVRLGGEAPMVISGVKGNEWIDTVPLGIDSVSYAVCAKSESGISGPPSAQAFAILKK